MAYRDSTESLSSEAGTGHGFQSNPPRASVDGNGPSQSTDAVDGSLALFDKVLQSDVSVMAMISMEQAQYLFR